jgi:di/tricarboxylate transporter
LEELTVLSQAARQRVFMTIEIGFLFLILGVMVILFLTEIFPVDLTAILGLVILIFVGFVRPNEAFEGFASPAVITMLSMFIVGASLLHTGVADVMGSKIHAWVGSQELRLIVTIMLVAGILSAFMNNIAAVAVLMPSVASIARRANLSPSRLFLPLSFGAIVGGTTTLVGTPPNILVGSLLEEHGVPSFQLFDFAPLGIILLIVSILFMITVGRKLLPNPEPGASLSSDVDLANLYQLDEMLFSLRVPKDSGLAGMTLEEAQLGAALDIQVVAILRGQSKELSPKPATVLNEGDILLVEGQLSDLKKILQVKGTEIRKTSLSRLPRPTLGFSAIRVRIDENSSFQSKSLKELYFRESYGVIVIAIQRGARLLRDNLGKEKLHTGDEFVAIGSR